MVLTSNAKAPNTNIWTGFSLVELAKPYFAFKNAGFEVDIASVQGGKPVPEPSTLENPDPQVRAFIEDPKLKNLIENTRPLHELNGQNYVAVFFVGGYGAMFDFPYDPQVDKIGREAYEHGAVLGSNCHGTSALTNIRLGSGQLLVQGKNVCGSLKSEEQQGEISNYYPEHPSGQRLLEDILRSIGANFVHGDPMTAYTCCDERLVTGQNPISAEATANEVIKVVNKCCSK